MVTIYKPNQSMTIQPKKPTAKQYGSILSEHNLSQIYQAIKHLRKCFEYEGKAPVTQLINHAVLSHVNDLLTLYNYPQVQHNILWVFVNLAWKYKKDIQGMIDDQCIHNYANLLKVSSYPIQHHILWILGMFAEYTIKMRDTVMKCILDHISNIIELEYETDLCKKYGELPHQYTKVISMSSIVVYQLCNKGKHKSEDKQKLFDIIKLLLTKQTTLLVAEDKINNDYCIKLDDCKSEEITSELSSNDLLNDVIEIRSQIVWSIYTLILNGNAYNTQFIDVLFKTDILQKLIDFLHSDCINDHIIHGIVRIFLVIVTKYDTNHSVCDTYVSQCVSLQLLSFLAQCMSEYMELFTDDINDKQLLILQELCWLLSEMTLHSITIAQLKENGLFIFCIELVGTTEDCVLCDYALMTVRNAIMHSNTQEIMVRYLCENGLIQALCEYGQKYDLKQISDEFIRCLLDCLQSIFIYNNSDNEYTKLFEISGGIKLLYAIKAGVVNGVFTLNEWKANTIIHNFFYVQNIVCNEHNNNNWYAFDMEYIQHSQCK